MIWYISQRNCSSYQISNEIWEWVAWKADKDHNTSSEASTDEASADDEASEASADDEASEASADDEASEASTNDEA